jgi:hypothetical protein
MPVRAKIKIIQKRIWPSFFMLLMPATDDEMEKKTRGTTVVKRRFRKISPKGLNRLTWLLKIIPKIAPRLIEASKIKGNE